MPDFLGGLCEVSDFKFLLRHIIDYFLSYLLLNFLHFLFIQVKIPEGGFVPKNLYLKDGELEKEACTITEDSIYQSVTLTKGQVTNYFEIECTKNMSNFFQVHEVFVDVEESGSVITWDFDVMRQDINFNVLRLLVEVQPSTLLSCAKGIY